MKRFGQTIHLKPGKENDYIRYHANVWPGVLSKIKECNISNYSIFIKNDLLFAYFEYIGNNFDADMQKMANHEETQKWWDVVKPLMEPIKTRKEGEFWADMEEIFHLE